MQSCESREVRERLIGMTSRLVAQILKEYRLYVCDLYSDNDLTSDLEQRPWINYKQTRSSLMKIFSKDKTYSSTLIDLFRLVKLKEFVKGKQLAEEFEDYASLIEICDELKDVEQLRDYIQQYGDKVSQSCLKRNDGSLWILVYASF